MKLKQNNSNPRTQRQYTDCSGACAVTLALTGSQTYTESLGTGPFLSTSAFGTLMSRRVNSIKDFSKSVIVLLHIPEKTRFKR